MVALLGSDRSRLQFLGYRLRLSTWFHDGRPPFEEALPETRHLPSAEGVAESNISSTRQSYKLPSAYRKTLGNKTTLGKDLLCRVPVYRHSTNLPLPSATRAALGTQPHMCAAHARRARYPSWPLLFAECPQGDTRQTPLCRVPRSGHSAKTITCAARDCYPVATNVTPLRRPLPLSFAECQVGGTRHSNSLPSVLFSSRRNNKKKILQHNPNFFLSYYTIQNTAY